MAACLGLCERADGDDKCEHELAADFKYLKLGDGVDQEKAIATSTILRSESPIPNSASRWKRCHAEKLNIYCVPIHKSQYLHPVDDVVHQLIQKSASGFSSSATDRKLRSKRITTSTGEQKKSSRSQGQALALSQQLQSESESALTRPLTVALTTESLRLKPLATATPAIEMRIENEGFIPIRNRVRYEYDYKSLLRDMIKPNRDSDKCDKWWAKFEDEVVRRYNIMEIVDRNLTQPDIDEEMSLAFSESFMARSSGNAAECKDPSKKNLQMLELLKDVQEEEDRVKLLRQNTLADQSMNTRTPVSKAFDFLDFRLTMFCLHFLEALDSLIENHVNDLPTDEHCFENLFQTFARIFFLEFRQASKRSMNIFGENVSSIPDLRCEVLHGHRLQGGLVITVAEVKPHVKESQPISSYNLRSGGPSEEWIDNPDGFDLPDEVFGQHAAELLVELPYTALSRFGNKECIFGMIIQCTRVRLTCLHMSEEHLQLLQESEPTELDADDKAKIHYSRSYDMLNREDRKHLAYILLLFAYFTDNDVFLK